MKKGHGMHPAEGSPMKQGYGAKPKVLNKTIGGLPPDKPLKEKVMSPKNMSGTHFARNAKDGKVSSLPMPKMQHLKG